MNRSGSGTADQVRELAAIVIVRSAAGKRYVLRVADALSQTTIDCIQVIGADEFIRGVKSLKVLIVLTEVLGWNRRSAERLAVAGATCEPGGTRIAVLGDPRLKSEVLCSPVADRRRGEVLYFLPEEQSKAWTWLAE